MQGFITIHRQLIESSVYKDSHAVHLWLHLLMKANHKDKEFIQNGKMVMVKRGQTLTGRKVLSAETGIQESKIQRLLKLFESMQMIEQHTNNRNRLITVLSYDKFQAGEQLVNNTRTTGEQLVNTNNNVNNNNNENKHAEKPSAIRVPYQKILDEYHSLLPELSTVQIYTDARKAKVKKVYTADKSHQADDYYQRYFNYVKQSPFLMGQTDKPFNCNFEWLMNINNMAKVVEGNYHGN